MLSRSQLGLTELCKIGIAVKFDQLLDMTFIRPVHGVPLFFLREKNQKYSMMNREAGRARPRRRRLNRRLMRPPAAAAARRKAAYAASPPIRRPRGAAAAAAASLSERPVVVSRNRQGPRRPRSRRLQRLAPRARRTRSEESAAHGAVARRVRGGQTASRAPA